MNGWDFAGALVWNMSTVVHDLEKLMVLTEHPGTECEGGSFVGTCADGGCVVLHLTRTKLLIAAYSEYEKKKAFRAVRKICK